MQICPACAVYKYNSSELQRTAALSVGDGRRSGTPGPSNTDDHEWDTYVEPAHQV